MALIALFFLLFGGVSLAAGGPAVQVVPIPVMPRPAVRTPLPRPPIQVVERGLGPRIDGVLEGAWQRGAPAEKIRSILYKGPPDPSWKVRAWVSESGLAVALEGVGEAADAVVTIDPDASRRGWLRITLAGGQATWSDCRATPDDARMPVPHAWSVATWDCGPDLPAHAAHGADGWELQLPWTSLGATTDDLQVNVRIIEGDHSLSLDPMGTVRDYTAHGRNLSLADAKPRRDRFLVRWDRTRNRLNATLVGEPGDADEIWSWELVFAGARQDAGQVVLTPSAPSAEIVIEGVEPSSWPYLVARRVGADPLAPGATRHLWVVNERGTLSTPVFDDVLVARIIQDLPADAVPVAVRDARGELLYFTEVAIPRGASEVRIAAHPTWPAIVQVMVGDRFAEGWLTAIRKGGR